MRGLSKKMLISILTSVIVFVTMVATTFAWVGIFTYSSVEKFTLNLKVQELDANYYLEISSSGKKGSFGDNVPAIDLKRQIINNYYKSSYDNMSNSTIEEMFNQITIAPSTTVIDENNELSLFEAINYNKTELEFYNSNDYYKFDLYFTVNTREGITETTTGIKSNVELENLEEMLTGTISSGILANGNPFKELPSNPYNDVLKSIPNYYNVNSKNACRVAFSIFEPIPIDEEYLTQKPFETIIFNGGSDEPNYDTLKSVYSLGGCLDMDHNLAIKELLLVRQNYYSNTSRALFDEKLNNAKSRNDLVLAKENKRIWSKYGHDTYLGCMNGIQTKMKISIYLWFEGWDADCLKLIERQPISLNLSFSSGIDD